MRLHSAFASLPLLTQRLLILLCVHFVRISAAHPRKLWIQTEHSSTPTGKCGGSVEQCRSRIRTSFSGIIVRISHQGTDESYRTAGRRSDGTWMRVGRQRRKADAGHFMVQETQSGFFPARIGSVTQTCQRSPVHEIRYCQIYSEFLRVWTNKPMCLWSKQTDQIFPGVVSHIFSRANQDILCASERDRFFFLHLKKGKIFSAPIKMLRNATDLIRILLLSVFIRKCCLFLSFSAGLF